MAEHPYHTENSKGIIDLERYKNELFSLGDYVLTSVSDNVLLIEFKDTPDGRDIVRNGIIVPSAHVQTAWRVGKVILAGPSCKFFKVGDYICFPNDRGIPVAGVVVQEPSSCTSYARKVKHATFLDESRVFGKCITRESITVMDDTLPLVPEKEPEVEAPVAESCSTDTQEGAPVWK